MTVFLFLTLSVTASADTSFYEGDYFITGEVILEQVLSSLEQLPILLLIPLVIVAVLLVNVAGSLISGVVDIKRLITLAIVVLVTIVMVGVLYIV